MDRTNGRLCLLSTASPAGNREYRPVLPDPPPGIWDVCRARPLVRNAAALYAPGVWLAVEGVVGRRFGGTDRCAAGDPYRLLNCSRRSFSVSISALIFKSLSRSEVNLAVRMPTSAWRQLFSKSWHSA